MLTSTPSWSDDPELSPRPHATAHATAHAPAHDRAHEQANEAADQVATPRAHLVAVRFGEFLRDCELITDEQWLAALASHWSEEPRRRIGDIVVAHGYLPAEVVEQAAHEFHDGLEVIEVGQSQRAR